jgi:Tfp pilus assembly protein PilN
VRPVNLIPQEQRRRTPSDGSGKGAYAVLGVLGLLLVMAVAYVLTANTVTERQSEAEEARVEAERLEAKAQAKDSFTSFEQIARTRVESVAGVAAGRFDWERFMRELSRVMPAGSWLISADASVTGAPAAGASGSAPAPAPAAGTAPAGPSGLLTGCTPEHSDVARMMVRLRQLHRVTDVELAQSSQEDDASAAAVDNCGKLTSFDMTVKFSPAAPVEAPRGASQVPVSLGGGS